MRLVEESLGAYNFNVLRGILEALEVIQVGAGVEVGVFDGGTSWFLLKNFPDLKLISVDPYMAYHEYDQARLNEAERTATSRLTQFGDRSVRIKLPSCEAAAALPNESFDFVFIDANHDYEPVKQDIAAWFPKVRKKGIFAGHDYRWEGVTKAVNEFADKYATRGYISPKESDIWWFIKE